MGFISWFVFGLIAGVVAKIVFPGKDGGGWIKTSLLGIVGSFVGGYIGTIFGFGSQASWSMEGFGTAVFGAILLLAANRIVTQS
jgi:uncharacterized membrane protein YeaQ/YmgE (transglycosylase-associated protein family)